MKQILFIFHRPTTNPGSVGKWFRQHGYRLDIRVPREGDPLPDTLDDHCGVVVFGGGMSANDEPQFPFLRSELDWIPTVLKAEKPFFGICLGAQLLARVLGAKVTPHPAGKVDIGYSALMPTTEGQTYFDGEPYFYHWNSEGFTLPTSATPLGSGPIFENQAFRYGQNAYGVQFHPEINHEVLTEWGGMIDQQVEQTLRLPGAQPWAEQLQNHTRYGVKVERWLDDFLPRWLGQY